MRTYVYGCDKDKSHPRKEVVHEIGGDPLLRCEICGSKMHRIPQQLRGYYRKPFEVLTDWMSYNFKQARGGSSHRLSPYNVISPDKPLPLKGK